MNYKKAHTFIKLLYTLLALLGGFVVILFLLHELGLTRVPGSITKNTKHETLNKIHSTKTLRCLVNTLAEHYPQNASTLQTLLDSETDIATINTVISKTYEKVHIPITTIIEDKCKKIQNQNAYPWLTSSEWNVVKTGLIADEKTINKVSDEMELSPRIIVGAVIGEQIRFFTTDRAQFESYFEPVKKLINLTQFSYGIAGIKPETAEFVEKSLSDKKSQYYLGEKYEHILDYPNTVNQSSERIKRLNDETHYYSYVYVALIQKMLIAQWQKNNIDISKDSGVISTLYNIGFNGSKPHPNPEIGGVPITIDSKKYSFGELADDFYWSGELIHYFSY